jgi:hypothetical protein
MFGTIVLKLFGAYSSRYDASGAKESSFLKNLIKPFIENVLKMEDLKIVLDPLMVHTLLSSYAHMA